MQIESELKVVESNELKKAVASDLTKTDKSLSELIKESEAKDNYNVGNPDDKKTVLKDPAV